MHGTPGKRIRVGGLVLAALLAGTGSARANTSTAFPANSLIIPTGSAFNDDCGAVSAYGLIYDVLRANPWLQNNGYAPITIFYVYLDTKLSPNRCVPTSKDSPPATGSAATWSDGCDILNVKAKLIDNTSYAGADSNIKTFKTTGKANVFPQYPSQTLGANDTVSYLGGPFVILAQDAPTFRKLLDGTIVAKDVGADGVQGTADDNTISFAPFRTRNGTQSVPPTSSCAFGTDHYVMIHKATASFVANIGKAFQNTPPRLALLASDINTHTKTVSNNILQAYLTNAGLNFTGANGCPPASVQAGNAAVCPNGAVSGQIYDSFDFDDLYNNQLATMVGTAPRYGMLWTPHWETTTSCGGSSCTANNARELQAMSYISTYLDGQNGLAAECASIASFEGDYLSGGMSNGAVAGVQLQTCVNNGAGACSLTTTQWGIDRNTNPPDLSGTQPTLVNCSDPTTASGTACAYYSYPGDSFAQTGDFKWSALLGHTASFKPNPAVNAIYRPGVVPLISHVASLDTSKLGTPVPYSGSPSASATLARAMIDVDITSRSIKDNTPGKSNILYLSGHNESGSVSGTKMMMLTLLQLGLTTLPVVSVITEVSRNSPIRAAINTGGASGDYIFQGTFNFVHPTPTVPAYNTNGDDATFRFPYVKGHLRARLASSITTSASDFSAGTVAFDAGALGEIPDPQYAGSGCAPYFTASCRTVFTTTDPGSPTAVPTMAFLNENNKGIIGPLMGCLNGVCGSNPATDLDPNNQELLIQRILAGDDSLIPGFFKPVMGGVDRSTVAVIGASPVITGTRPQMAYFGAADGMLHAVCADVGGPCDMLGRELWAYLPRTMLSTVRYNTARIDGAPHVIDAFGDFYRTGQRSWRTILMFQTGQGDTTGNDRKPAVYGLDISDPANPKVIWEYALADVATRGSYELGVGFSLAAGRVQVLPNAKWYVYAQSNNGGTAGGGNVVTAIDMETGAAAWQQGYVFTTALRSGGASVPPATGIPNGAIAIDKAGQGYVTDVVYGTLYGDVWEVDPATGVSRYGGGTGPLFRWSTDYHPMGAKPAIYVNGGIQYAVVTTGGYVEKYPNDTTWNPPGTTNYALAVSLNTPAASTPLDETSGPPYVPWKFAFGAGEKGVAQATVVGNQVFITTDTADTNNNTDPGGYGTGAASGHMYRFDIGTNTQYTSVVLQGGASSVINVGDKVYAGASSQTQEASTTGGAASTPPCLAGCGQGVDPSAQIKVTRKLWLRTQ